MDRNIDSYGDFEDRGYYIFYLGLNNCLVFGWNGFWLVIYRYDNDFL